jgi:hypothetical protein
MTSSLQNSDDAAKAVQKTPNRVSLEDLQNSIDGVEYIHPQLAPIMTIAVVSMKNGYVVVGKSAPADPDNFNAELGKKFALEDAQRQMWPLLGYALRDKLHNT